MTSEKLLRQDLKNKLALGGWVVWFSPRVKFLKQQDIFGIYDGIRAKGSEVRLIQFTTRHNKNSHIKKMKDYKELYGLFHIGELWLWDGKKKEWEMMNV